MEFSAGKPTSYGYPIKETARSIRQWAPYPNTADMLTTKKIDADTLEANFTKAGKHVETATLGFPMAAKPDDNAEGATDAGAFNNVLVWDKGRGL